MSRVEALQKTPFSQLSFERKLDVKRLGPYQPKPCLLIQTCGTICRTFRVSWYNKAEWLCYGEEKDALFCFYCLLFCPNDLVSWTGSGVRDLKHLASKIKKHQISEAHLRCAVQFKTFCSVNVASQISESRDLSIRRHNATVDHNRHILGRVIDAIKFLGIHELPFRGHNEMDNSSNRGVFLDLLKYIASLDNKLCQHLNTSTVARYTSKDIQNDLLDSMYHIYLFELKSDILSCDFLAVQADETTDVTCTTQLAVVFRFVKEGSPVEQFHSFVQLTDRSAVGISGVLKGILNCYDVQQKLIAQTYDGAAVMSGAKNGVQALMKVDFPHAHFLHCYAHQLNLVIKRMCSNVSPARIFFANVSGFSSFFSTSTKRSDVLRSICKRRLPNCSQTRWNFNSRVIRGVQEIQSELQECFDEIESTFREDDQSVREAVGLRRLLDDGEFCFFLDFFAKIFYHVDVLYNAFQNRFLDGGTAGSYVSNFCLAVSNIRQKVSFTGDVTSLRRNKTKQTLISSARECCDVLLTQLADRLNDKHLTAFSLLQPQNFSRYRTKMPLDLINTVEENFPMISSRQLECELRCIYSNNTFLAATTSLELFQIIRDNSLTSNFPSVFHLLNISLTTPVSSAESERSFSTLKRIKTYLRNRMGQDRLNALAVLSVHNDVISSIPNFNQLVIEHFAKKTARRAQFLYKR